MLAPGAYQPVMTGLDCRLSSPTATPYCSARSVFQVAATSVALQLKLPVVETPMPPNCFRPAGPSLALVMGRLMEDTAGVP